MEPSTSPIALTIADSLAEAAAIRAAARNNVPVADPKGLSPMGFLDHLKLDFPIGPPPPTLSPYFPIFPPELTRFLSDPPKYFKDPNGTIANYRHPDIPVLGTQGNSNFENNSSSIFGSPTTAANFRLGFAPWDHSSLTNHLMTKSPDVDSPRNPTETTPQEVNNTSNLFCSSMPALNMQPSSPTAFGGPGISNLMMSGMPLSPFMHPLLGTPTMLPSGLTSSPVSPDEAKECVVCGDKASGYTYQVICCNACKGFFRRTIQRNIALVCQKDNNCSINKNNRSNCPACRFRKCILMGMSDEIFKTNKSAKQELVDEDDSEGVDSCANVDEEELVKRCAKLADAVSFSFEQHFGSFRVYLAEDSIAPILRISSVDELRSTVKSFIGTISENAKFTEKEKTDLADYGMRAFTALVCSLFQQTKPSLSNQPLFKLLPQTPRDLDLLAKFNFKEITDDEIAVMCASSLIQSSMLGLGNHKVIDIFSRQLARCLYYRLKERIGDKCMETLNIFSGCLCKLYQ